MTNRRKFLASVSAIFGAVVWPWGSKTVASSPYEDPMYGWEYDDEYDDEETSSSSWPSSSGSSSSSISWCNESS